MPCYPRSNLLTLFSPKSPRSTEKRSRVCFLIWVLGILKHVKGVMSYAREQWLTFMPVFELETHRNNGCLFHHSDAYGRSGTNRWFFGTWDTICHDRWSCHRLASVNRKSLHEESLAPAFTHVLQSFQWARKKPEIALNLRLSWSFDQKLREVWAISLRFRPHRATSTRVRR